jgi:hypothetical protein
MRDFAIMLGIVAFVAPPAYAIDKVTCVTDKREYFQGETVRITVRNNSNDNIEIPDRRRVDGGFAVIEVNHDSTWRAIELFAVANVLTYKTVKPNERHVYVWETKGYNRNDTLATPGKYRVRFQDGFRSNEFLVKGDGSLRK